MVDLPNPYRTLLCSDATGGGRVGTAIVEIVHLLSSERRTLAFAHHPPVRAERSGEREGCVSCSWRRMLSLPHRLRAAL